FERNILIRLGSSVGLKEFRQAKLVVGTLRTVRLNHILFLRMQVSVAVAGKKKAPGAQVVPRRPVPKAGEKVGELTVIQRVRDDPNTTSLNLKMRVRVECSCGKRLTIPMYYLVRDKPKTSCGHPTSIKVLYY